MKRKRQNIGRGAVCSLKNVIGGSDQTEYVRHKNGDTGDIVQTIMYADTRSSVFLKPESVRCLYGRDLYGTLHNVWKAVRNQIRYRPDKPGHERVKSPGALVTSGYGDCKSFSLLIGSILRAMGIPYSYRFTSYAPGDYTHVYVVAHTAEGDVIMDAVYDKFDREVPYKRRIDLRPADHTQIRNTSAGTRSAVNGIGAASGSATSINTILIGLLMWLGYNTLRT